MTLNKDLNPLIDLDYLVYRVGFAVKDDEPLEYALSTVKASLNTIWDTFLGSEKRRLFLTGKGNFRDKVATVQVYKGNRDPSHKPKYYSEIREYLINVHGAEVVEGMEAEDACGIEQYAHKDQSTVIVGVDKDLLGIPGWHYNPVKDKLFYQTLADANEHFWKQVITGDRVDNIRGIDGLGDVKAMRLLAPCNKEWQRMHDVTLAEYKKQHGDDAERVMDETCKLIWILRKDNETYNGSTINQPCAA